MELRKRVKILPLGQVLWPSEPVAYLHYPWTAGAGPWSLPLEKVFVLCPVHKPMGSRLDRLCNGPVSFSLPLTHSLCSLGWPQPSGGAPAPAPMCWEHSHNPAGYNSRILSCFLLQLPSSPALFPKITAKAQERGSQPQAVVGHCPQSLAQAHHQPATQKL